ncbi:hypothetical protein AgCh_011271 [Apium graveolens]
MKRHNGRVQKLTQERYIPELNRNLISLGKLVDLGYTVMMKNNMLKVTKGDLEILKGRKDKRNLFVLEGGVIIRGEVCITDLYVSEIVYPQIVHQLRTCRPTHASACNGGWTSDMHLAWSNKVFDTIGSDLWNDGDGFEKFAHASLELSKVYMELGFLNNSRRELFAVEMHLKNTINRAGINTSSVLENALADVGLAAESKSGSARSVGSVALQAVAGPYMWNVEWFFALQRISRGTPSLGTKKTYKRKLHVYKKGNARMVESRRK